MELMENPHEERFLSNSYQYHLKMKLYPHDVQELFFLHT